MKETTIEIEGRGPGTWHSLRYLDFGKEAAAPFVYIQGGLHADEAPGILVAHCVSKKLASLEQSGELKGRVRVVPAANPIGLSQFSLGQQEGRFDLYDGRNFNRHYPDFAGQLRARISALLSDDATSNLVKIRSVLKAMVSAWDVVTPADHLRKQLMSLAIEADFVLDLHCDGEAEVHLYTQPSSAATFAPLARRLQARAVLLAEVSGLNPLDEALVRPWLELAVAIPDAAIPLGCASTTVELRGRADVEQNRAQADAEAIIDFLRDVGVVHGEPAPLPPKLCEPTPLAGSEAVVAPSRGIICYSVPTGSYLNANDVVAELIDPYSGDISLVRAGTAGVFYARAESRIAERGKRLGKIAGLEAFRDGALLSP